MDDLQDVSDEGLDETEAELDQDHGYAEDLARYEAVDRAKLDPDTKALLAVAEGDVNTVELEDLPSSQVGELSEARFGQYLAFRENGGAAPVDSIDEEPEPGVPAIPDWGSSVLLSDSDFQKKMQASYGKAFDIDSAEAV